MLKKLITKIFFLSLTLISLLLIIKQFIRTPLSVHGSELQQPNAGQSLKSSLVDLNESLNPYIVAIPGSGNNNNSLIVSASNIGERITPVYFTIDDGPTGHIHSHTMEFEPSSKVYRYTVENFFGGSGPIGGSIEITTTETSTETLTSGRRRYERWPIVRDEVYTLDLQGGQLSLFVVTETLPAQRAYIVVVDTLAPVDPPSGWQSLSHAYSIQASGALNHTEKSYLLTVGYSTVQLGDIDPTSLLIYWYDAGTNSWQRLGGVANTENSEVVLSTTRFGTFMLFAPQPTVYLPLILKP